MTTEWTRPVARRIGDMVVTIRQEGVEIRAVRKQRAVLVRYDEIVRRGLMKFGVRLSEKQWADPLRQLRNLSRLLKSQGIKAGWAPQRLERQQTLPDEDVP
jgi:hypothetical protein